MATLATFKFPANLPETPEITLFISHDGYPAGAAANLRAMLQLGGLVEGNDFFRANPWTSIVSGHEAYANTSYRYTLTRAGQLLVERRRVHVREEWEQVYLGDLLPFLNAQPGPCLYLVALEAGGHSYLTLPELCLELARARYTLRELGTLPPRDLERLARAQTQVAYLKRQVSLAVRHETRVGRFGLSARALAA